MGEEGGGEEVSHTSAEEEEEDEEEERERMFAKGEAERKEGRKQGRKEETNFLFPLLPVGDGISGKKEVDIAEDSCLQHGCLGPPFLFALGGDATFANSFFRLDLF